MYRIIAFQPISVVFAVRRLQRLRSDSSVNVLELGYSCFHLRIHDTLEFMELFRKDLMGRRYVKELAVS